MKYVVTDYWKERGGHRPYQGMLHDAGDFEVSQTLVLAQAIALAGAVDGDEIEIVVRKTGRRPFGDRIVRFTKPHTYEREPAVAPDAQAGPSPDRGSEGGR